MSLEDTLGNLSLYDAKKYFRKVQNIVYNYTDMESKVREATNNEPWGTPSSLMEQISQGSFNYKERTEIIGMIFKRFTEKTSMGWRQIYKALQLLEYILKHGSERFVDDCRSNLSIVAMLRDFHYVDSQGTDQGLNVRTRATAIVDLLRDNDAIRAERKKAKELQSKVTGGNLNAAGLAGRTGGFTKSNKKGISVSADFDDDNEVRNYHTYDDKSYGEYKEEYIVENRQAHAKEVEKPPAKQEIPDLLDNLDFGSSISKPVDEEDEFGDFQSAPKSTSSKIVPTPTATYKPEPVKKEDPFASLFSDAKTMKNEKPAPKKASAAEDDEFGDFLSSNTKTEKPKPSGDFDLLSF